MQYMNATVAEAFIIKSCCSTEFKVKDFMTLLFQDAIYFEINPIFRFLLVRH